MSTSCRFINKNKLLRRSDLDLTNLGMGPTKTKTSINIASLNICGGLYSKEELICQLAQEKSLHVLALCETELEHIDEKLSFNICGYKTLLPPKREGEKFTRLLLLVKQDLECVHRQDLSNSACIYVELKYPHTQQRLLICCFYREFQVPMYCTQPADCTKAMTAQEGRFLSFGTTLSKACNEGKDIYIMGDLNIDLLRINDDTYYNKSLARIYQSMMGENGLTPIRMGTTFRRIQQNGVVKESELDHLLTTCPQKVIRHGAEEFGASDHHCIMAEIEFGLQKQDPVKRTSRDLRRIRKNPEILKSGLAKFPLQDILFKEDVNDMVTIWTTSVQSTLDKVAPVKTKVLRNGKPKPSLDQEALNLIAERKRLKKALLSDPSSKDLHEQYKSCRNKCNNTIKTQHRKAMGTHLTEESSMSEIWKTVNSIINPKGNSATLAIQVDDKKVEDPSQVAHQFNLFFKEKIEKLVEKN